MYFIISKKHRNGERIQKGIVIATTIERAAKKVGSPIVSSVSTDDPDTAFAKLEDGYELTAIPVFDRALVEYEEKYHGV